MEGSSCSRHVRACHRSERASGNGAPALRWAAGASSPRSAISRLASGASPAQSAAPESGPSRCGPNRVRAWHLWSHSAARRPPFFELVVSNPLVRRLLPAATRRSASPGGVGQARPPSHARASARFRRTGVSALAQTSLLTLEAASLNENAIMFPFRRQPSPLLK